MNDFSQLLGELQTQRQTLEGLLLAARRGHFLGARGPAEKNVLALLSQSLDTIRLNRNEWLRLDPAKKQGHAQIAVLLRENQNTILKILSLDGEPAAPMRRGPAAVEPPPAPNSHFVSRKYRRNSASGPRTDHAN